MIFSSIWQLRDLANGFGHVLYISAKTDIAYASRHCLPSSSPSLSLSMLTVRVLISMRPHFNSFRLHYFTPIECVY